MGRNNNAEEISRMILNYLQKTPDAADTLEGISKWWLEYERVEHSMNDVKDALENLIKKGIISMFKTKDGTTMYKINKEI